MLKNKSKMPFFSVLFTVLEEINPFKNSKKSSKGILESTEKNIRTSEEQKECINKNAFENDSSHKQSQSL